jgi:RNA polymerase sigma factor (sigma-70 family)
MDAHPSEHDLVTRAAQGDSGALSTLLERHGPTVRGRIAGDLPRKWRSVLSVDDVLQQAYTDAFLAIGRFVPQSEGSFLAWLTRLARNALLDALDMLQAAKRGGGRGRLEPDSARSLTGLLDAVKAISATPSRAVAAQESLDALRRCIDRLPESHRMIIELYDLQQRPIEEVAASLQRSVGAAYMLRARAHRMLAEALIDSSDRTSS